MTSGESHYFTAIGLRIGLHTLKTDTITLQALHCLIEQGLAFIRHSGDIELLPFNGCINMFKDFLHRVRDFFSNTVARNECDLMSILSGVDANRMSGHRV
jgi:hypothetical protein